MPSTRPTVLGDDPGSLDALWQALVPDTTAAPVIRAVMITSVDGTSTVGGRTAPLGTPTDQLVYTAMRARADVVLVGATTALEEDYGPAVIVPAWGPRRSAPPPTVVLLTRSLSDGVVDHCVRRGPGLELAVVHGIDPAALAAARRRGVRVHELDDVPLGDAVRALMARLGAREVDFEGGPRLLARLLAEGAVDELILSLAPEVNLGGDSTRLVNHEGTRSRTPLRVAAAFSGPDGGLYTRWLVDRTGR